MAKGDDLEERLIEFAVRIVTLCEAIPKTTAGRHLGNQLVRSGTSPAFNYGEARAAESKRDFVLSFVLSLFYFFIYLNMLVKNLWMQT